ncbi:hypothetical protein D5S17_06530 [Pseudonocardiaceae bacterium YIM PH 21723]|nr:hypothetical protein D5S17_06530 [Pseudonocardiaceae bacterium YIM PH 21723]
MKLTQLIAQMEGRLCMRIDVPVNGVIGRVREVDVPEMSVAAGKHTIATAWRPTSVLGSGLCTAGLGAGLDIQPNYVVPTVTRTTAVFTTPIHRSTLEHRT